MEVREQALRFSKLISFLELFHHLVKVKESMIWIHIWKVIVRILTIGNEALSCYLLFVFRVLILLSNES